MDTAAIRRLSVQLICRAKWQNAPVRPEVITTPTVDKRMDRAGVKYDFVFMYKISEKETGCACDAKIHTSTLEHKAG